MPKKNIPQYKRIENELLEQIHLGHYKKDDMIPTELELSKTYQVSRVTVRKALDNLVAKGMLRRISGVGTFIRQTEVKEKVPQRMGFTDEMLHLGVTPRTVVTTFRVIPAPANIARILNLKENDSVYYIQRERYGDDVLMLLETSYMSVQNYPEISMQILQGSKYRYFEDVRGEKIDYNEHTVTAIHPSAKVAQLFGIAEDVPIIKVANITYLTGGKIMDYTEQIHNSPKFQLRYIKR